MRFARKSKETFEGIEIRGKPEFLFCTQQSLGRLQSTSQFELIRNHLRVIHQGRRSGMKAWTVKPTFTVGKRPGAILPSDTRGHYSRRLSRQAVLRRQRRKARERT